MLDSDEIKIEVQGTVSSGKSTFSHLIAHLLREQGINVDISVANGINEEDLSKEKCLRNIRTMNKKKIVIVPKQISRT
jgi:nucleoside-triphosphatase THEP1